MTNVNLIVDKQKRKGEKGERKKHDLYPTPYNALNAIAYQWHWSNAEHILDIGAGDGRFGRVFGSYCDNLQSKTGVELRDVSKPDDFDYWYNWDYRESLSRSSMFRQTYDYIVANPPFKLAEIILRIAFTQLDRDGRIQMLLPSDFSHGSKRSSDLFTHFPPYRQIHIADRIDFTQSGNPHQNMALFEWRAGHQGFFNKPKQWMSETWEWKPVYEMMKMSGLLTQPIQ